MRRASMLELGTRWLGLFCWVAALGVAPIEAQTTDSPLVFGGRFADVQGRTLYNVSAGGNQVTLGFTLLRTGQRVNVYVHPGWGDNGLRGDGLAYVTFSPGASVGDVVRCHLSVGGSSPTTLVTPQEVVLTSQDVAASRAEREFLVGGPAGARALRFRVRFADQLGRNLWDLTAGGGNVSTRVTNRRNGLARDVYYHPGWGDNALAGDGSAFVDFSEAGNQAARAGDTFDLALSVNGSTVSTLAHPRSFVVTDGDIAAGSTPVYQVVLDGPVARRSGRLNLRFQDEAGRSLYALTAGGRDSGVRVINRRSGQSLSPYFHPDWGDNQLAGDGQTGVDFTENGNQAVRSGDVLDVSVWRNGSTSSQSSHPRSFLMTDGDVAAGATPVRQVFLGGPLATRGMRLRARFTDASGRNLFDLTAGGRESVVTFTGERSGLSRTPYFHPDWGDNQLASDGGTFVDFTESGNQAVSEGDVIRVAVSVSGSRPVTVAEPASFVVTRGDILAGETPVHGFVVGGLPSTRSLEARAQFTDALGRNLFDVTGAGRDTVVRFTHVRTAATVTPYLHPDWGDNQLGTDGSTFAVFTESGNQAMIVGDRIAVTVTPGSGLPALSSEPPEIVVTAGDIQVRRTPVWRVRLGGRPLCRTLRAQARFVLAGGQNLFEATAGGRNTVIAFRNRRTGRTVNPYLHPDWADNQLATDGSTFADFSGDGNFTAVAGDEIEAWVTISNVRQDSDPASFVVTTGDLLALRTPVHLVTLGRAATARRLTVSGRVRDSLGRAVNGATVDVRVESELPAMGGLSASAVTPSTWSGDGDFEVVLASRDTLATSTGTRVRISAAHPVLGSLEATVSLTAGAVAAGRVTRDFAFVSSMARHFEVTGTVTDSLGRRLDGVRVRASLVASGATSTTVDVRTVTPGMSGRPGSFSARLVAAGSLAVLPGSELRLEAVDAAAGTVSVVVRVTPAHVAAGGLRQDLTLPAARQQRFEVEGQVADRLGRPADRVRVRMTHLRLGNSVESVTPTTSGTGTFRLVCPGAMARAMHAGDRVRLDAYLPSGGLAATQELAVQPQHLLAGGMVALRGARLTLGAAPSAGSLQVRGVLRDRAGRGLDGAVFALTNVRTGERVTVQTPATAAAGSFLAVLAWPEDDAIRTGDVLAFSEASRLGLSRGLTPGSFPISDEAVRTGMWTQDLLADLPLRTPRFVLKGRVVDAQGRAVDRATVTLANPRTGARRVCLTPCDTEYGSFLAPFADDASGAAAASDLWTASIAASGLTTRTFTLAFSEEELEAGVGSRDLSLAEAAPGQPLPAAIVPASAPRTGPTSVTLTGTAFTGATGARLEGAELVALGGFSVASDGRATGVIPAGLPPGSYRVVLFGPGGASPSGPSFVVVDPYEGPPVAVARVFGRAGGGAQVVRLDATASTGLTLAYAWSLAAGPAGAALLEQSSAVAFYEAGLPGDYRFSVRVTDARGRTATAESAFTIAATLPVVRVDARPEVILRVTGSGVPVEDTTDVLHLDGSGSFDPASAAPLRFGWSLVDWPDGSSAPARLAEVDATSPLLSVPLAAEAVGGRRPDAGRYLFRLSVTGSGGTTSVMAAVTVLDPVTLEPRADAGVGQTARVRVEGGRPAATIPDPILPPGPDGRANLRGYFRLDGHESSDPRGRPLTYLWRLLSSPAGQPVPVLSDPASPVPTFTATAAGEYQFGLTVDNGSYESQEDEVAIRVQLERGNSRPSAEAVVRVIDGQPPARARADLVELDGTHSSDRDDPPPLSYAWVQTAGRPVELVPASPGRVRFVPPEPGRYRFGLTVTDARGGASEPYALEMDAVPASGAPPSLLVVASGPPSAPRTGEDFADGDLLAQPRSLRVNTLERVMLSAFTIDPDGAARGQSLRVRWRQADGPRVVLLSAAGLPGAASAVAFEPTTSRVHLFIAQASQFDAAGNATGVEVERRVRVIVDSPRTRVPEAAFDVVQRGRSKARFDVRSKVTILPSVRPRTVVELDGRGSRDLNEPPRSLLFRWEQVAGPGVVLSNPASAIASFVVPLLTDRNPHRYIFRLFVDNGADRSEPVAGAVDALPDGAVELAPGLNCIGLLYDPATGGEIYRSEDLLRETGASFVARAVPGGRFEVQLSNLVGASFELDGAHGYLLRWPAWERPSTLVPEGPEWSAARRSRVLSRGLNLMSCPAMLPETADAELLRSLTGASFVAGFEPGGRVVPYLRGLTPPFPLDAGRGYLLVVPQPITPTFPTR